MANPIARFIRKLLALMKRIFCAQNGPRRPAAASYYLTLDGFDGDQTFVNQPAAGVTLRLALATNGTPQLVSRDARLAVGLPLASGTLMITVPRNTASTPLQYDPVVLRVAEDDTVRARVSILQNAAEPSATEYEVSLSNATGVTVTFRDSANVQHQLAPGFSRTFTIGGEHCAISFDGPLRIATIVPNNSSQSVWEETDIAAGSLYPIHTGVWLDVCAAGADWFSVG